MRQISNILLGFSIRGLVWQSYMEILVIIRQLRGKDIINKSEVQNRSA
jgi:hypothetical protein